MGEGEKEGMVVWEGEEDGMVKREGEGGRDGEKGRGRRTGW